MLPLLKEMRKHTSLPIIVKPNAGLPKQKNGDTYYDVEPEEFADALVEMVKEGACVIGGCCGTTPAHIAKMIEKCRGMEVLSPEKKSDTVVSSYGRAVTIGDCPVIIGERINPTGKKLMKQALKDHDMDYLLKEAVSQQEMGAHILDVNVGLPDIDELKMMQEAVTQIQGVTNLPLQIDTADSATMEAAMRLYNGKPMINSVNGKQESMDQVFPLIKKYGGVVVGLTLDEDGIPETAEGRLAVAKKIISEAAKYGIDKKDIVIDVLAMTISSDPEGAKTTLKALELVRKECGVRTVLGVSNISFGLPSRPVINANFYTMAMQNGLSAGIINPLSEEMMKSYYSYCALMNYDNNCEKYIAQYADNKAAASAKTPSKQISLKQAVENGLKDEAASAAAALAKEKAALDIINEELIPALDVVGKGFEQGTVFLPQLLMSAEAAKAGFDVITSNPPYMTNAHGIKNPEAPKAIARHDVLCTLDDLAREASRLLRPGGRFYLIHRPFRLVEIFQTLTAYKLEPKRMKLVYPFVDKEPNMVMIEAIRGAKSMIRVEEPLIVYKEPGVYHDVIYDIYGY